MTSRASGQLTPQYQLSALVWAHRARFGSSLGDIYGPSLMWSIGKKSYFSYLTRNLSIVNILCISSEHKVTIVNFQGGGVSQGWNICDSLAVWPRRLPRGRFYRKIMKFIYPPCIQRPHRGIPLEFAKMFSSQKTRMIGLPYAEESAMIC